MPVLLIYGMPDVPSVGEVALNALTTALQDTVSTVLGISSRQVSVFYPANRMQQGLGERIVCFVEGLLSLPGRTVTVRRRLANSLEGVLDKFAQANIPTYHLVKVFVRQLNTQEDGFASHKVVRERK